MKTIIIITTLLCIQLFVSMKTIEGATQGSLVSQCSTAIQQLTSCLGFATGSDKSPTKQCCDSVSGMKMKQPECLCFFIEQAHNGSDQIKSLGIKEANLLQLPNACQLTNASVSNCPKLLGISPTSPDASIFKDNGTSSATSSSSSSSSSPLTTNNGGKNSSGKLKNGGFVTFFGVFMVTILFVSPFITLH